MKVRKGTVERRAPYPSEITNANECHGLPMSIQASGM